MFNPIGPNKTNLTPSHSSLRMPAYLTGILLVCFLKISISKGLYGITFKSYLDVTPHMQLVGHYHEILGVQIE